jgi:multiple sugar transport system permease protein
MTPAFGTPSGKRGRRRLSYHQRRSLVGFLLVAPGVLFVIVLFIAPLLMTGWMSLHDWPLLGDTGFTGLTNYRAAAEDDTFLSSLVFTTKYVLVSAVITFTVGFALALVVRGGLAGTRVLRTCYFLPVAIGWALASFLWVWLLNGQVGVINYALQKAPLVGSAPDWFGTASAAFAALVLLTVWKSTGFAMVLFLVGMQSVPPELFEAARVDGAGIWREIRHIMLPLLRPTFALVSVFLLTAFYLGFDQFYILTRGGPQNSTVSIVYWIYNNAFVRFHLGYGAALAMIFLVVLVAMNTLQVRLVRKDPTR